MLVKKDFQSLASGAPCRANLIGVAVLLSLLSLLSHGAFVPHGSTGSLCAAETPSSYGAPAKVDTPILRVPLMKTPPTIDGVMRKGEWDDSSSLSGFWYDYGQADFRFMAPPQTQVVVHAAYDRDNLYWAVSSPVFPVNSWFKARGRFPDVLMHPLYGILWDDKLEMELRPAADLAEGFKLGLFRWDVNPINSYADWHWSQQGGTDFKWKSNAVIRSQLDRDRWVVEFAIPFAGLKFGNYAGNDPNGQPRIQIPPADGTVLRAWFVRGIGGNGAFFNCFDAHVWNTTKTQLILDSKSPSFQINDLGPIMEDTIDLRMTVKNHNSRSETVRVGFFVESAEGPIYSSYDLAEMPGGLLELRPGETRQLRLRQPFPGVSRDGNVLWFDVRSAGQPAKVLFRTRLIRFHSMDGGEVKGESFRNRRVDVIAGLRPPRKDFEFMFAFSPTAKRASAVVDRGISGAREEIKAAVEAKLTILKDNDDEDIVAEVRAPFRGNFATFLIDLPQVVAGESYKANLLLFDTNKRIIGEEDQPPFSFRKEVWEGNTIGLEDAVWDPYTPIVYAAKNGGRTVLQTVRHEFSLDQTGLPAQIDIRPDARDLPLEQREAGAPPLAARELLDVGRGPQFRSPLRVEAVVNGKRITATVVKPAEAVRQGKSEAVYRSTLKVGPLDASLTIQYDCDGAMHATVTYSGMKAKIDSLELVGEIDGLVDLCLSETGSGAMAGADRWECALPQQPGIVWDSRSTQMELFYNRFIPWFWFGSADRGWTWFCDSDRGWILDRESTTMRLQRDAQGATTWRVLFVNHPTVVDGERSIAFTLLTHPSKPKPKGFQQDAWHHCAGPAWADEYQREALDLSDEYLTARWRTAANAPKDWPDEKRAEWRNDAAPFHRYGRHRNALPDSPTPEMDRVWEEKATYFFERHIRVGRRVGWWMDEYFPVAFGRSDNLAAGTARFRDPLEVQGDELPWHSGFVTGPMRNHYKRLARVSQANNVPQRQHTWANNAATLLESTTWSSLLVEECGAANRAYEIDLITQFPNSLYRYMAKNWTGLITTMCSDVTPCEAGDDKRFDRQRLGLAMLHDFGVMPTGPHGVFQHKEQAVRLLKELEQFGFFADATLEKLPFWRNAAVVTASQRGSAQPPAPATPVNGIAVGKGDQEIARSADTSEVRVTAYRRPLPDRKGYGVLFVLLNETLRDVEVPLVVHASKRLGGPGSLTSAAVFSALKAPPGFEAWWKVLSDRQGDAVVLRDIESGDAVEKYSTPVGANEAYGPIYLPSHDYRVFYGEFGG